MVSKKKLKEIITKHSLNIDLEENIMSLVYHFKNEVRRTKDPLTEEEHHLFFDFFWNRGNEERETNVSISEKLKQKVIRNRAKIVGYDMVLAGQIEGINITSIIDECHLNSNEESEIWAIFHKLWPGDSARDSDEINGFLGTYQIVEQQLKFFGKINVLDIGCGKNGNGISTLTARYGGKIRGYGVDLDIQEHPSNVNLVKASVESLPFRDNFFDVIYSSYVLYCFNDKRLINVITEILRVLKPNCQFIFDDHNRDFMDYKEKIVPATHVKATVQKGSKSAIVIKKLIPIN